MKPRDEFEAARKILSQHYESVMLEAAEDIIRNGDEFGKGVFGGADEIIDKHYTRVSKLASLFCNLRQFAAGDKPKGTEPLGRHEFRCFGCGHVIRQEDDQCQLCGWTWK